MFLNWKTTEKKKKQNKKIVCEKKSPLNREKSNIFINKNPMLFRSKWAKLF